MFRLAYAYNGSRYHAEYWNFFNVIAEPGNRAAMLTFEKTNMYLEKLRFRSGTSSLVMLEENYKMVYAGLDFKAFSPFLDAYNEILGWMEAFGFIELWRRDLVYNSVIKTEEVGPQVLTMDHLQVGFLACLIPLTLSVAVFIAEHVKSTISNYGMKKLLYNVAKQLLSLALTFIMFVIASSAITVIMIIFKFLVSAIK